MLLQINKFVLSSSHHNVFHEGFLRQQDKLETKKLLIISTAIIITGLLTQIPNQLPVTLKVLDDLKGNNLTTNSFISNSMYFAEKLNFRRIMGFVCIYF